MQQSTTRNILSSYDIKKIMIKCMCDPRFSEMWIAYFTDQFKYHKDLILHQFSWDDTVKAIICDITPKDNVQKFPVEVKAELESIERRFLEFCINDPVMISIIRQNTIPTSQFNIVNNFKSKMPDLTYFVFSNMLMSSFYNKEHFVFRIEIVD